MIALVTLTREFLGEMIAQEGVVEFLYSKEEDEPDPQRRIFSPWEISEDEYTVLGWDHDRDAPRRFTIAKVFDLKPYDEDYVRPAT